MIKTIADPRNNGDIHLVLMLKFPYYYSIRVEIIKMFLESFYKMLWDNSSKNNHKLDLQILAGDHKESAFLEILGESECNKLGISPLLNHRNEKISVMTNNMDAIKIRRRQLANFISDSTNHQQPRVDADKMYKRLNHHGNVGLEITGSFAARGLPFYTITLA